MQQINTCRRALHLIVFALALGTCLIALPGCWLRYGGVHNFKRMNYQGGNIAGDLGPDGEPRYEFYVIMMDGPALEMMKRTTIIIPGLGAIPLSQIDTDFLLEHGELLPRFKAAANDDDNTMPIRDTSPFTGFEAGRSYKVKVPKGATDDQLRYYFEVVDRKVWRTSTMRVPGEEWDAKYEQWHWKPVGKGVFRAPDGSDISMPMTQEQAISIWGKPEKVFWSGFP